MEKITLSSLSSQIDYQISVNSNSPIQTSVYKLKNGDCLKLFDKEGLSFLKTIIGADLEKKITSAEQLKLVPEIIVPSKAIYNDHGDFQGYTMKKAQGISYNDVDDNLTINERCNLKRYADQHHQLESIVKRGNKTGIVFPDLCTCDNIFIHKKKMSLIDYDGLQINDFPAFGLSTSLGAEEQYVFNPKYCSPKTNLFTTNLDKKSLIILYFLTAFNVDLNKIGKKNYFTGKTITLEMIANMIGLDDDDLLQKVWKALSDKGDNDFLEDDVYRIADKYNLTVLGIRQDNICQKKLIKK